MNWLAHLHLSEPELDMRLGNLLADVVRGAERARMSAGFRRGALCHAAIDAFTDAHPVVRRSCRRLDGSYRRFAGVLVDVFYDHFLARGWERHAPGTLEAFNEALRDEILRQRPSLPPPGDLIVQRMIVERRLLGYRDARGIERALARMGSRIERRFGRRVALAGAIALLDAHGEDLQRDFEEFFPQLQAYVGAWLEAESAPAEFIQAPPVAPGRPAVQT
ncbi:MAG: ACP phosphodiesterase [Pseudomonadota bacterium]|jgi:acyl carrier protein phosphodiesterase